MESTTKFANMATITDPSTGEVTMYIHNEKWGPIVTGATVEEAKAKMSKAFLLSLIANTFWTNDPESGFTPVSPATDDFENEMGRVNNTLSHSY